MIRGRQVSSSVAASLAALCAGLLSSPAMADEAVETVAEAVTAPTGTMQSVEAAQVTASPAPTPSAASGWTIKPRWRVQIDYAEAHGPYLITGLDRRGDGEVRRHYFGFDATTPGGIAGRIEADISGDKIELTDAYAAFKPVKDVTVTIGQQKSFMSMEDMTSDLFTSFNERAFFNSAFGFERRVGASAAFNRGDLLLQGGVFLDDAMDLNDSGNDSISFDGRAVYSPKVGKTRLHFGASAHRRDFNDYQTSARYRARPFIHTTDRRLIDTRSFSATGEQSIGAEFATVHGPFHAAAEAHWLTAERAGLPDPTFFGGYAEVGVFLTPGDSRSMKPGVFDKVTVTKPLSKGGWGAWQINARYDHLDLTDGGINGGRQSMKGLSLVWTPESWARVNLSYGRVSVRDAAVAAGADLDYGVDVFSMRLQFHY